MYPLLKRRLSSPWPEAIMVLWYSFLFFAALLCGTVPEEPFHYIGF